MNDLEVFELGPENAAAPTEKSAPKAEGKSAPPPAEKTPAAASTATDAKKASRPPGKK